MKIKKKITRADLSVICHRKIRVTAVSDSQGSAHTTRLEDDLFGMKGIIVHYKKDLSQWRIQGGFKFSPPSKLFLNYYNVN